MGRTQLYAITRFNRWKENCDWHDRNGPVKIIKPPDKKKPLDKH